MTPNHLTKEELEAGLQHIAQSPKDNGVVEMIVRRPEVDGREILESAELNLTEGLVGDNWKTRGSTATPDGSAHPEAQINIMNSRAVALLAQEKDRWALAGDQFFIDLDLGVENLPAGTRLALGSAILEVTAKPHTGCDKFAARYGRAAALFVNSTEGKKLHLRGINAKVVQAGTVRVGDAVKKI
ncbi:MAG TPA: MOSC domain-containing protein [Anaerolineales bacterium]|nr:MOSC domain-containing protein [Anaerolineales bacterium]